MAKSDKAARRAARSLALQALYEIDVAHHEAAVVLHTHLEEAEADEASEVFVRAMVLGVQAQRDVLDAHIQRVASEWPVDQMAPIDRNILRMAIYELLFQPDTPLRVAINEAVELARLFGSDSSRRFVNGALGTFAKGFLSDTQE